VVPEASYERTDNGVVPAGEGWFVVNARDARWCDGDFGAYTRFEGPTSRFERFGINIGVLQPGEPSCMYHREDEQEDFLVLAGECVLIIEDEERHLKAWDFVHCPPMTPHGFVAKGDGPCVIVATGNRRDDLERVYPRSEAARRNGAEAVLRPGAEPDDEPEREPYGRWSVARPATWAELPWAQAT
jgi:uncharacterized cupin superfamily protein